MTILVIGGGGYSGDGTAIVGTGQSPALLCQLSQINPTPPPATAPQDLTGRAFRQRVILEDGVTVAIDIAATLALPGVMVFFLDADAVSDLLAPGVASRALSHQVLEIVTGGETLLLSRPFTVAGSLGGASSFDSLAAATRSPTLSADWFRTAGYAAAGDGGGGVYVRSAAPGGPGKVQTEDGQWWQLEEATPNPLQFGAKGDRTTDDSAAVQVCIAYCGLGQTATPGPWKPMRLTAMHLAGCLIDRAVDSGWDYTTPFVVFSDGGGGFLADSAVTVIDSTLVNPGNATIPSSENIHLVGLRFEATDPALGAIAISWKFLRLDVDRCTFHRIQKVVGPNYIQSWRVHNCRTTDWLGCDVDLQYGMFDCHFTDNAWEAHRNGASNGIRIRAGGTSGGSIVGNLFEGGGTFFRQAGGYGTLAHGNHTEANVGPDYIFSDYTIGGRTQGVSFKGNYMGGTTAGHAGVSVQIGDTVGFQGGGNSCQVGTMYDTSHSPYFPIDASADVAEVLYTGNASGLDDPARAAVGRVHGTDGSRRFYSDGNHYYAWGTLLDASPFVGVEQNTNGVAQQKITVFHGPVSPGTIGYYGADPFQQGSICWNSAPSPGQPTGWYCAVSGSVTSDGSDPGTWVALANL